MLATQSPDAEGDATDAAPFQELKRNLTAALQLSMQLGEGRGKQWETHARQLRKFIEFVDEEHTASIDGCLIPIGAEQASRFAQLLLAKRQAAHLTLTQVAKLAGVSARTISNIEQNRHSVSRETLQRLREIPQLDLQPGDVAKAVAEGDGGYNCHIPPGYDTLEMVKDLEALLSGPGCHIEQTNAYLEHRSAMAYVASSQNPTYVAQFREAYPSKSIANKIIAESGQRPLKVIALGPGDGHLEVRLLQHLLGKMRETEIKFVLFDISQPLLTTAYQYTLDTLGARSAVETVMVQGNFHNLAQYPQVTGNTSKSINKQTRVYLMMGNTIANLDNEVRFFLHNFSHCKTGDFLVLDFGQRKSPSSATEAEIRRSDPGLSSPFKVATEEWLSTPLRLHCPDLISYNFSLELEMQCPIPGSYMLDAIATVRTKTHAERRFSMFRFKRYDEELLLRTLARFGWHCVTSIAFGTEKSVVALLLVKREISTKH